MSLNYSVRRYWPVPAITQTMYTYQNINTDKNLQYNVTKYFTDKLDKWVNDNTSNFYKFKNEINEIDYKYKFKFIFKLLKKLIHITNINWYDLRDNCVLVKKYIYIKLLQLFSS